MGTFHNNMGPLHGMTVVVRTADGRVIVGRCHEATEARVVIHDAETSPAGDDHEAFLKRVAQLGQWPREKTMVLQPADVTSLSRLGYQPTA